MKTLRITFYNWTPKTTSKERVEGLLKNFFWQQGQEHEDWNEFDGEIEVLSEQDRGGDCAKIIVSDKWSQWTYDHLKSQKDVRSVEIFYGNDSLDFVRKNRSEREFHSGSVESQINQFV